MDSRAPGLCVGQVRGRTRSLPRPRCWEGSEPPCPDPALSSAGFRTVSGFGRVFGCGETQSWEVLPLATGTLLGSLSNPQVLKGDEARRWGSVFKRGLVKHKVGIERCCVGGHKLVKSTADAILSLTSCFGGVC